MEIKDLSVRKTGLVTHVHLEVCFKKKTLRQVTAVLVVARELKNESGDLLVVGWHFSGM